MFSHRNALMSMRPMSLSKFVQVCSMCLCLAIHTIKLNNYVHLPSTPSVTRVFSYVTYRINYNIYLQPDAAQITTNVPTTDAFLSLDSVTESMTVVTSAMNKVVVQKVSIYDVDFNHSDILFISIYTCRYILYISHISQCST